MISGVTPLPPLARDILDFWFVPREGERIDQADPSARVGREVWFRKDDAFDAEIRARFGVALAAGMAGAFGEWCTTPEGSLARVVLLDQFTRNAFRGTPLGVLLLGRFFSWWDIASYWLGIAGAGAADHLCRARDRRRS